MGREITDLMVGFGTWFLAWHMAKDLPEASATPFTRSYWTWIGVRRVAHGLAGVVLVGDVCAHYRRRLYCPDGVALMERVLIEFTIFIAALATIVWTTTNLLEKWVVRRRLKRMWKGKEGR